MNEKIHTIQSSDKKEFDRQVNQFLEVGGELMDGGYKIINNDDGIVYSQVILLGKKCNIEFHENGRIKCINRNRKKDGIQIWWYENGQKEVEGIIKDGKPNGLSTEWYESREKKSEITYEDGSTIEELSWYKNGRKKEQTTYKNDGSSKCTVWYENGKKDMEVYFDDNLNIIDEKHWNLDGSVKKEIK